MRNILAKHPACGLLCCEFLIWRLTGANQNRKVTWMTSQALALLPHYDWFVSPSLTIYAILWLHCSMWRHIATINILKLWIHITHHHTTYILWVKCWRFDVGVGQNYPTPKRIKKDYSGWFWILKMTTTLQHSLLMPSMSIWLKSALPSPVSYSSFLLFPLVGMSYMIS